MIDRNVRFRLLLVLEIMRQSGGKMSVQDIIDSIKMRDPWALVERRAILADLKVLEQFGYVILEMERHNKAYATYHAEIFSLPKVIQPKRISKRALPKVKQIEEGMGEYSSVSDFVGKYKANERLQGHIRIHVQGQ